MKTFLNLRLSARLGAASGCLALVVVDAVGINGVDLAFQHSTFRFAGLQDLTPS